MYETQYVSPPPNKVKNCSNEISIMPTHLEITLGFDEMSSAFNMSCKNSCYRFVSRYVAAFLTISLIVIQLSNTFESCSMFIHNWYLNDISYLLYLSYCSVQGIRFCWVSVYFLEK